MATFPTGLHTVYTLVDNTDDVLASHPNTLSAEIRALEDKVGVNSSAETSSHDYKLRHLPAQEGDWDVGGYEVRAETFESDVATGTIPLAITSTTKCTNLNADQVDGKDVDGSNGAGEITTNDGTQTLTNKTLTSPDINTPDIDGGTLDGVQIGGTTATGELIVNNSSDEAEGLGSQGTTGQVLTSAGAGANPTWNTGLLAGMILMWSGTIATIPTGWYLCDGNNSTPDLTNRFIVCADADDGGVAKSTITGSALASSDTGISPSHTHEQKNDAGTSLLRNTGAGSSYSPHMSTEAGSQGPEKSETGSSGTGTKVISVFYALAFIMKS